MDRIAVIKGGEIIALGTPASLKQLVADRHVVEIEVWVLTTQRCGGCATCPA